MADLLILNNFPALNLVEKTKLSADVAAAATTFTVKNPDGYSDTNGEEDIIIIGLPGQDGSEKKEIVTISSSTFTVAALSFAHKKYTPVASLRGDQIKIYRAANVDGTQPADADFSLLATVNIEVDQQYTEYNDEDGGNGYWYKQTFYHSVKDEETDIADSIAVRGGGYGHYVTVEQVRKSAGFKGNDNIPDADIAEARDDAESTVKGALYSGGYVLPINDPIPGSVVRITRQLAAAYLLQEEYGAAAQGTNKDGYEKEDKIMTRLEAIQEGKITLTDVHTEEEESKVDAVSGWPNDNTEDASEANAGGERRFTSKQTW